VPICADICFFWFRLHQLSLSPKVSQIKFLEARYFALLSFIRIAEKNEPDLLSEQLFLFCVCLIGMGLIIFEDNCAGKIPDDGDKEPANTSTLQTCKRALFVLQVEESKNTVSQHCFGHFGKSGDVGAGDIVPLFTVCFRCFVAGFMDAFHDNQQAVVNFFTRPRKS